MRFDQLCAKDMWWIIINMPQKWCTSNFFTAVPSRAPYFERHEIDEAGCLQVKWEPISEDDRNGEIIWYTITYVAACFDGQAIGHEGNVTVDGASDNATVCDLRPGLKYRIGLSGTTSEGTGPIDHRDVYASKCSAILNASLYCFF